jgi:ribonucleoside-diphosphate reductase alpha chain
MPDEREALTRKLKIGDLEGYATVGFYEDGAPGEVFLTVQGVGTLERGLCHALGLMISLALQRGVPAEEIAEKLTGLQFEPRGVTGSPDIPMVSSLADYLGRWMTRRCLPAETPEVVPDAQ